MLELRVWGSLVSTRYAQSWTVWCSRRVFTTVVLSPSLSRVLSARIPSSLYCSDPIIRSASKFFPACPEPVLRHRARAIFVAAAPWYMDFEGRVNGSDTSGSRCQDGGSCPRRRAFIAETESISTLTSEGNVTGCSSSTHALSSPSLCRGHGNCSPRALMAGIFLNIVLVSDAAFPAVSVLNAVDHFPPGGDEQHGDVLPDRHPTGSLGPVVPRFRPRLLHDSDFLGGLFFSRPSPAWRLSWNVTRFLSWHCTFAAWLG